MKCSACGKDIDKSRYPSNIKFCPYCGDELHDAAESSVMQFCPYCGEKLIFLSTFCPHCGNKLAITGDMQKGERKDFIEHAAKPVIDTLKETFGPERKTKKLYKQWVEYSDLPSREMHSISKENKPEDKSKEKEITDYDYRDYIQ
jgi:predicted RNA-binding Zn-ribbon protein involved in translation (DUF1610 family)